LLRKIQIFVIILLILPLSATVNNVAGEHGERTVQTSILRACQFLHSLYNSTLQLVRETPSSNTYWIASDNLLAQGTLSQCNPILPQPITIGIGQNPCCNKGNDLMHEAILGRPVPLPIHNATIYDVTRDWTNSAGNMILYEYHNGTGVLSPSSYADVAAYTALESIRRGDRGAVLENLNMLNKMWDANGMVDDAFTNTNSTARREYQTYKDALYLFVLQKAPQFEPWNLLERILTMQGPDGGFNTAYYPNGTYAGQSENAETTSIVTLALEALLQVPWWETYWYLFLIPIPPAAILLFLLLHHKPRTRETMGKPSRRSGQLGYPNDYGDSASITCCVCASALTGSNTFSTIPFSSMMKVTRLAMLDFSFRTP
jgi:hypothetical protein